MKSFSSIKCLHNTTRSWASNEQSLMNFVDGHSALVTCYIAGVGVEWRSTYEGHYYTYICFLLRWPMEKYSLWL